MIEIVENSIQLTNKRPNLTITKKEDIHDLTVTMFVNEPILIEVTI